MNEQDIPIDIHTNKLLDWLISRRHCNKDWHVNLLKIREKINNAIQDMPAHEGIVKLVSGSHINYFHCVKIVDILKETEADTKNLFGRYGSQRMKDWQEIINLYEANNVYLAEAAQILIRNTNFEVPGLKKQVAKLDQFQNDCLKKEKDYTKSETTALNDFHTACKNLGIAGKHIKKELVDLLKELPDIYDKIGNNFKSLQKTIDLYSAFMNFLSDKKCDCMALSKYLIANGNTTSYEWTYGEKPISIEPYEINIVDEENENNTTIDFGDAGGIIDFDGAAEIDFGNAGDIDFGDENIEQSDINWGNPEEVSSQEIDFNISLEESGIVVEDAGVDGGVARGTDSLSLLDNPRTRNQIIDEVLELEAFLKIRLYEMHNESDLLAVSHMQNAPTILQMQSVETITSMMDSVQIVINDLLNKRTTHLHNIKHSPKYIDILVSNLKQKLVLSEKMKSSRDAVKSQIEEAKKQIANIVPLIKLVVDNTKLLQKQIETEISKKYKGRIVNIVGGVNFL